MDSYNKTVWVNGSNPPINAENLNHIESGIEAVTNEVIDIDKEIAAARGSYTDLKERLDHTGAPTDEQVAEAVEDYLDKHPVSGAEKYVEVTDTSDTAVDSCTSPDTVYIVRVVSGVVSTAKMRVICSPTVAGAMAQYAMTKDGYVISRKFTASEWGAWDFIPDSKRVAAMISAAIAGKADSSAIPTKTSQLTNDSGFLTSHQDISGKENISNKKTSISNQSQTGDSDTNYPTVGAVRDFMKSSTVLNIDTVAEMVAMDLNPGTVVLTEGYHAPNDGGGAMYRIVDSTDKYSEALDNGKKAELIIIGGCKNARQFGAYGDGTTDDTTALQTWLNDVASNGGIAYLPHGQYKITAPIVVDWSHHGGNPRNFLQRLIGDGCTSYESGYDNSCIVAYNIGANRGAVEFTSDGNTWGTQVEVSNIGIYCDSSCDPMSFCLFYGDSRHLALNRVKMKGYNDILVRCGSKVVDSSGKVTDSYEHICCTIEHCDLITRGTKGFSLLPESVLVENAYSMLDTLSLRDSFIGGVFAVHCNNFSAESCTITIAGMKDKLNTVEDENMGKFNGYQIDYATGFLIIETASTIIKNTYFEDYKRAIDIAPICGNIRNVLIEGCYFNPGSNQTDNNNDFIMSDYGVLIRAGKSGAKVVYTEISHNVFRHDETAKVPVYFAVAAIKNEASEKLLCYANAGRPNIEADQIVSQYGEFITEKDLVNPTKTSELINDSGFITKSECNSIWKTSTAPTEPAAPEKPGYGFTISNLTGADRDVQIGDMILYSYYYYTVTDIIDSVAYAESRVSIRGAKGATYTLTAQDKTDIANIVLGELPTTEGVLYGNQSN